MKIDDLISMMRIRYCLWAFLICVGSCTSKQVVYNETNSSYLNFDHSVVLPFMREGLFNWIPCPDTVDFDYYKKIKISPIATKEFRSFCLITDTLAHSRNVKCLSIQPNEAEFKYVYPSNINSTGAAIGKVHLYNDLCGYLLLSRFEKSETQTIYLFVCRENRICSVACLSNWAVDKNGINNSYRSFFLDNKRIVSFRVAKMNDKQRAVNKRINWIYHYSVLEIDKNGCMSCSSEQNSEVELIIKNISKWKNLQTFVNM